MHFASLFARRWFLLFGIILINAVSVFLAGCASDDRTHAVLDVRVQRVQAARGFLVTWRASAPVDAIVFARSSQAFRSRTWIPQVAGQKLERRGGREIISANVRTREFKVLIPEQLLEIDGDYPMMMPFSDGGIALYTGHLDAAPAKCDEICADSDISNALAGGSSNRINLVPASGERVIVGGGVSLTDLNVNPPAEGMFAYFGKRSPAMIGNYSVIVDPGLPAWLLPEMNRYFPKILALNESKLGRSVGDSILILMPYQGGEGRYLRKHSGSVVGRQMLISLFGSIWEKRTQRSREEFVRLLAHESFHLWNANLYKSIDQPGGRWLHEGSAEAFAYLALLETGAVSATRFNDLATEAINRCLVALTGEDSGPPRPERFWDESRNAYDCGAVLELMADQSLRKRGNEIWGLWKSLFTIADSNGGRYTHEKFFEQLSELGDPAMTERLRALVATSFSEATPEEYFINTFSSVGHLVVASDQDWPDWYRRLVGERALQLAVERDCSGSGYFISAESHARLVGGPWCRNLKVERDIDRIGSLKLWNDGVGIYDHVRETCRFQGFFNVERARSESFDLLCPTLPRRPLFIRLQSALYPGSTSAMD